MWQGGSEGEGESRAWGQGNLGSDPLMAEGLRLSHLQNGSVVPRLEDCHKDGDFPKVGSSCPDLVCDLSTQVIKGRTSELMC